VPNLLKQTCENIKKAGFCDHQSIISEHYLNLLSNLFDIINDQIECISVGSERNNTSENTDVIKKTIGHFGLIFNGKDCTMNNGSYEKILLEKETAISGKQEETLSRRRPSPPFFDDSNLIKSTTTP
jgi:hypothetical protein